MFVFGICDDDVNFCNSLEGKLMEYNKQNFIDAEFVVFYSGKSLCDYMQEGNWIDLLFLDIEMNNVNGIEVGRIVREEFRNQLTQIIYVSAKESYYKDLFDIQPLGFILKPVTYQQIESKMKTYLKRVVKLENLFTYKKGNEIVKVPVDHIVYLESDNKEIRIVLSEGEDVFYGRLQYLYEQLAKFGFLQIHKSYVVNKSYIRKYNYDSVVMFNKVCLPISQSNRKKMREELLKSIRDDF